ncbi:MAG: hypothetical protein MJ236_01640 [Clostridia bacterium]|nr:hypothetical protein [Clostridia bacterium]
MLKRVLSITMAVLMLVSTLALVGCGKNTTNQTEERLPVTLSMLIITSNETKPEDVKAVEAEINKKLGAIYSTHVELIAVTYDNFIDMVSERTKEAKYLVKMDTAVKNYNDKAVSQASSSKVVKKFGKWEFVISEVAATTVTTREQYTSIVTQFNEHGILEVVYPKAASPIDIIMVQGKEMYDALDKGGYLKSIKSEVNSEDFTKFSQFIYPTYFELLQAVTGDIKGIPNNNLLAEYTYLVVKKEIADKYSDFDYKQVTNYSDEILKNFLANVKANEDVIPMNCIPNALGIFKLFNNSEIAIGTYCDPMIGYNKEEGTSFSIQSLFDIPQYTDHLKTMEEYKNAGYFTSDSGSKDFAVDVIKGDASIEKIYGDDYYVKVLQNPFVEIDSIYQGMFAVSEDTSNTSRALEVILELTTDAEIKNLLQYGIEGKHYVVNDNGTITRLNHDYMMDINTTGNIYKGYPEEGMLPDQWEYVKKTNLDSLLSPYLTYFAKDPGGFNSLYYVDDAKLDAMLKDAITRAVLNEVFVQVTTETVAGETRYSTYDDFLNATGTPRKRIGDKLKLYEGFRDYFVAQIMAASTEPITATQAEKLITDFDSNASGARFPYEWYFDRVVELKTSELYGNLMTATGLDTSILNKMASLAGMTYENYKKAIEKATTFYGNIDTLKIMTRIVIWSDLSDDEWEAYEKMGAEEFEKAVYDYVKNHYNEKNNVDEEKYEQLVQSFIASFLKLTDPADNSIYTISWDEYQKIKAAGLEFQAVIDALKGTYSAQVPTYLFNDADYPAEVYKYLMSAWYAANGTTENDFKNATYDEILAFAGITYSQLMSFRRTDTQKFSEYIAKLKSQYKSILVEEFSLARYKNGNISNDDVLNAIYNKKAEEKTGVYANMCATLGMSYEEYKTQLNAYKQFSSVANQMRTKFIYTLLTVYSQSEINNFDIKDVDAVVYDVVYNSGFYTNELCTYICTDLSTYMNKKSDIKDYKKALGKIAVALDSELKAAGYTEDQIVSMSIADAQAIIYDIVKTKFFGDVIDVSDLLTEVSEKYLLAAEEYTNIDSVVTEAQNDINTNSLFISILYYLKSGLDEAIAATNK